MSSICSPVEGKGDDENDNADNLKVGGRNERHENHTEGRHEKSKSSVNLDQVKVKDEETLSKNETNRPFAC